MILASLPPVGTSISLSNGKIILVAFPITKPELTGPKVLLSIECTLSPSTQRWFLGMRQVSLGYGKRVATTSPCMPLTLLHSTFSGLFGDLNNITSSTLIPLGSLMPHFHKSTQSCVLAVGLNVGRIEEPSILPRKQTCSLKAIITGTHVTIMKDSLSPYLAVFLN